MSQAIIDVLVGLISPKLINVTKELLVYKIPVIIMNVVRLIARRQHEQIFSAAGGFYKLI